MAYIEREAAIEAILGEPPDAHYPQWYADKIKAISAADVAPVQHGRWICKYDTTYGSTDITCSRCRDTRSINGCYEGTNGESLWYQDNYCSNCGAKMDGKST